LGVGRVVEAEDLRPEAVRAAVVEVLAAPEYRRSAGRVRAEIESLPGPEATVPLLERLASECAPLTAPAR
jgi:UDP:flavonoid glycosyltransferase YjiC (YdhE family)